MHQNDQIELLSRAGEGLGSRQAGSNGNAAQTRSCFENTDYHSVNNRRGKSAGGKQPSSRLLILLSEEEARLSNHVCLGFRRFQYEDDDDPEK